MRFIVHLDYFAFYLLLFSLPFGKSIFVPILFVWLCAVFLSYFIKHDYSFDRFKELVVLLILFYCLQSIGLVSSANTRGAFFDMQLKLSLLLVPLLYPYGRKMYESSRSTFLWTFVVGCGAASFYYFGYATYRSLSLINGVLVFNPRIPVYGGPSYFLSHDLSYLIHPSYLALYHLVALLIIGLEFNSWWTKRIAIKIVVSFIALLIFASLIMLQSRAGILGFGLLITGWLFFLTFVKRKYILGLGVIVAISGFILFVFTQFNRLAYTAKSLENSVNIGINDSNKIDGTNIRFWIWKSAFSVIENHPIIGVGTGDVRDELQKQYEKRGMSQAVIFRYNAHNQYLETWLGTGIFGLFALLAMLFVPLWMGVKKRDWLVVGFLSLCSMSFMFESMLNSIAGVGFFAIFYTILVSNLAVNNAKPLS